jgi:hypothetical protein
MVDSCCSACRTRCLGVEHTKVQSGMISDATHERNLAKLRKDFGEVFLAALEDPETVEIVLNADGILWQERARGTVASDRDDDSDGC